MRTPADALALFVIGLRYLSWCALEDDTAVHLAGVCLKGAES